MKHTEEDEYSSMKCVICIMYVVVDRSISGDQCPFVGSVAKTVRSNTIELYSACVNGDWRSVVKQTISSVIYLHTYILVLDTIGYLWIGYLWNFL